MGAALTAILLFLSSAGRASEGLRPPSGEARKTSGGTAVDLGFGTVLFPSEETPGPAAGARPGERLACNRGTFSLRYELVRGKGRVSVRKVSVGVRNRAEFFAGRHPGLEEHERGHQRINEAGAPAVQEGLSSFAFSGTDLKAAEARLRERFREELSAVEALHKEWDATSVFVSGEETVPEGGGRKGAGVPPAGPARPSAGHGVVEGVPQGTGHGAEQGGRAPRPADLP